MNTTLQFAYHLGKWPGPVQPLTFKNGGPKPGRQASSTNNAAVEWSLQIASWFVSNVVQQVRRGSCPRCWGWKCRCSALDVLICHSAVSYRRHVVLPNLWRLTSQDLVVPCCEQYPHRKTNLNASKRNATSKKFTIAATWWYDNLMNLNFLDTHRLCLR